MRVVTALFLAAIIAVFAVTACGTLSKLVQAPKPDCKVHLRYDGGKSKKPYYAVEICDGQKPRVLCESATKLPPAGCPKE